MFGTLDLNMVILAWMGHKLSCGQAWGRHTHTDTPTGVGENNTRKPQQALGKRSLFINIGPISQDSCESRLKNWTQFHINRYAILHIDLEFPKRTAVKPNTSLQKLWCYGGSHLKRRLWCHGGSHLKVEARGIPQKFDIIKKICVWFHNYKASGVNPA